MAGLGKPENEGDVAKHIIHVLSSTRYACSSLARLDGGAVNFTFRGMLRMPTKRHGSVIVKHAAAHLARNVDFPLGLERSVDLTALILDPEFLSVAGHTLIIAEIRAGCTARISRPAFGLWAWN